MRREHAGDRAAEQADQRVRAAGQGRVPDVAALVRPARAQIADGAGRMNGAIRPSDTISSQAEQGDDARATSGGSDAALRPSTLRLTLHARAAPAGPR